MSWRNGALRCDVEITIHGWARMCSNHVIADTEGIARHRAMKARWWRGLGGGVMKDLCPFHKPQPKTHQRGRRP